MSTELRLMVVGRSGVGKSTILNILGRKPPGLEDEDDDEAPELFKTSQSGASCTQKCAEETVHIKGHPLVLVDTMGFPDPDPDYAADYYDSVVDAVNNPLGLNAILWVVKGGERMDEKVQLMMKVFMSEFNNDFRGTIILLINGTANIIGRPRSQAREREKVHEELKVTAAYAREEWGLCGPQVVDLISTDLASLTETLHDRLWALLIEKNAKKPVQSDMRKFHKMKHDYNDSSTGLAYLRSSMGSKISSLRGKIRDSVRATEQAKEKADYEHGLLTAGAAAEATGTAVLGVVAGIFTLGIGTAVVAGAGAAVGAVSAAAMLVKKADIDAEYKRVADRAEAEQISLQSEVDKLEKELKDKDDELAPQVAKYKVEFDKFREFLERK